MTQVFRLGYPLNIAFLKNETERSIEVKQSMIFCMCVQAVAQIHARSPHDHRL